MKTDRFARAAALVLALLLLVASQPAAGQIVIRFGKGGGKKSEMSVALARQIGEVLNQFQQNRRALRGVQGPDGQTVFPQEEVAGLIVRTEQDLDQAIEKVGEPGLDAMRAWVAEEFRRIQEDLAPRDSAPRAVAVVASLERFSYASAPQPRTIPAETSNRLLDRAGEVASRIFLLAKKDDLKVKLWVGSTPERRVAFEFWPQGKVKGVTPVSDNVRTNGQLEVLRGLYSYRAIWTRGPVRELIEYPSLAGTPNERGGMDLVTHPSFFCCEFKNQACHHVKNAKECHP